MKVNAAPHRPDLYNSIVMALTFSLLNPHVYLDTVVLIGSIGSQFEKAERICFAKGAIFASFLWFFGVGYSARALAPLFSKANTWKVLDFVSELSCGQ